MSNIKIIKEAVEGVLSGASGIIDSLPSNDKKQQAKNELSLIVTNALNEALSTQADVIKTEMNGNLLQRSWRPLLMLTFGFILVCKWFGWTDANIPEGLEMKLMDIVQLGLGGFIVGRSVEKVTDRVTKNIDVSFLKKKDRKL